MNRYRFGAFVVDPGQRLVLRDGEPMALTGKSFDVLVLLVRRHGQLVSKEEMMASVWPGVAVDESNLTSQISMVRRALGESAGRRGYIATVAGHGYRFVAPVEEEPAETVPADSHPFPAVESASNGRAAARAPERWLPARAKNRWLAAGATVVAAAALVAGVKMHFATPAVPWRQLTFDRADDGYPDVSPDGRYVAWSSNREGRPDIWVMRADGSGARDLTRGHGDNLAPAWSPDGRRIAFESTRDTGVTYIFVMNADGTDQHVVSPKRGTRAAWAPDGGSLVYNSVRDGSSAILKLDLATKIETVLRCGAPCADASWSPDGQWILHTRSTPRLAQLFVMDAEGGHVRQLTRLYDRKASVAVWSPDGSRIAFSLNGDGGSGVFVMRSDGTEVTRLTRGFTDATEPAWSHDGSRIYFQSRRSGNYDIYVMNVPRGTGERLTEDVGEDTEPALSPDGNELAFASNRAGKFNIFVENLLTGGLENLTHSQGDSREPAWSPDGSTIAFSSNRTGRWQIFLLPRKDGTVRRVSPDDESWRQPAWSPDGKVLAAGVGPMELARIKLLPLAGGAPIDLAPDSVGAGYPAWSPDGKTIAFDRLVLGIAKIFTVPAAGGEARAVTGGSNQSRPAWRRDGALAFSCACGNGTQIMLLEPGSEARALTSTLPDNLFGRFSRDGTRAVFVSNRDGNSEIYQIYN